MLNIGNLNSKKKKAKQKKAAKKMQNQTTKRKTQALMKLNCMTQKYFKQKQYETTKIMKFES